MAARKCVCGTTETYQFLSRFYKTRPILRKFGIYVVLVKIGVHLLKL